MLPDDNADHLLRHALHALEDFNKLRERCEKLTWHEAALWHSISHHLRHTVYRAEREWH